MQNSNFLSSMQCTHLPNPVYTKLSLLEVYLRRTPEIAHQIETLRKYRVQSPFISELPHTKPRLRLRKAFATHMTE